jgi:hypothetical protein
MALKAALQYGLDSQFAANQQGIPMHIGVLANRA